MENWARTSARYRTGPVGRHPGGLRCPGDRCRGVGSGPGLRAVDRVVRDHGRPAVAAVEGHDSRPAGWRLDAEGDDPDKPQGTASQDRFPRVADPDDTGEE